MRDDEQFTTDEPTGNARATERADERPAPAGARHERVLELDADAAWELLGSNEGLERWLGDAVDLDIAAGAEGTIRDGEELLLTEVESVEPGRRVSLRWWSEERGAAIVDLTLEPLGDERTRLVVTEIPAEVLRVPATPATIGGDLGLGGAPQLRAGAGASAFAAAGRALALA